MRSVHTVTVTLDRLLTEREWREFMKAVRRVPYVQTLSADVVERGAGMRAVVTTTTISRAGPSHSTARP
jgi:hypothetical protein